MLSSMRLCSNVLSQQIVQTALGGYQSVDKLLLPGGRIYEQREYIYNAINDIPGLSAVKPKAAFYMFPKIDVKRFNITNDEQFVLDFLHEHHILLVHGGGFKLRRVKNDCDVHASIFSNVSSKIKALCQIVLFYISLEKVGASALSFFCYLIIVNRSCWIKMRIFSVRNVRKPNAILLITLIRLFFPSIFPLE